MRLAPLGRSRHGLYHQHLRAETWNINEIDGISLLNLDIFHIRRFALICYLYKFSFWNTLVLLKRDTGGLGTSSSESVLPAMMDKMEKFGCSKSVVGW